MSPEKHDFRLEDSVESQESLEREVKEQTQKLETQVGELNSLSPEQADQALAELEQRSPELIKALDYPEETLGEYLDSGAFVGEMIGFGALGVFGFIAVGIVAEGMGYKFEWPLELDMLLSAMMTAGAGVVLRSLHKWMNEVKIRRKQI